MLIALQLLYVVESSLHLPLMAKIWGSGEEPLKVCLHFIKKSGDIACSLINAHKDTIISPTASLLFWLCISVVIGGRISGPVGAGRYGAASEAPSPPRSASRGIAYIGNYFYSLIFIDFFFELR